MFQNRKNQILTLQHSSTLILEDPKAFTYALRLAKEVDADIILATDPDADRLGVYSKDTKSGEYKSFTGNMSGMLIAEYLLSQRKEKGLLHENGAF